MTDAICGIDEAGRGPVIGPMILCCAVFDGKGVEQLAQLKVRDSKEVTPARRRYLEPLIKKIALEYNILSVSPREIDRSRKKTSLNEIEAGKVAQLILSLKKKPDKIILDAVDSIAENYKKRVISQILKLNEKYKIPEIVSEHKADSKYIEVGAASILAKVERDRAIDNLKEKHGDFGSGYPSDPLTKEYIQKLMKEGPLPDYVRKSWNTVNFANQKTLGDY